MANQEIEKIFSKLVKKASSKAFDIKDKFYDFDVIKDYKKKNKEYGKLKPFIYNYNYDIGIIYFKINNEYFDYMVTYDHVYYYDYNNNDTLLIYHMRNKETKKHTYKNYLINKRVYNGFRVLVNILKLEEQEKLEERKWKRRQKQKEGIYMTIDEEKEFFKKFKKLCLKTYDFLNKHNDFGDVIIYMEKSQEYIELKPLIYDFDFEKNMIQFKINDEYFDCITGENNKYNNSEDEYFEALILHKIHPVTKKHIYITYPVKDEVLSGFGVILEILESERKEKLREERKEVQEELLEQEREKKEITLRIVNEQIKEIKLYKMKDVYKYLRNLSNYEVPKDKYLWMLEQADIYYESNPYLAKYLLKESENKFKETEKCIEDLLVYLLRWQYESEKQSASWIRNIVNLKDRMKQLFNLSMLSNVRSDKPKPESKDDPLITKIISDDNYMYDEADDYDEYDMQYLDLQDIYDSLFIIAAIKKIRINLPDKCPFSWEQLEDDLYIQQFLLDRNRKKNLKQVIKDIY